MNRRKRIVRQTLLGVVGAAAILIAGYPGASWSQEVKIALSGSQQVPPVTTSASGSGSVTVAPDKAVSGSVTTTGVAAIAAHIHQAAAGQNGPVIIPLTKTADNVWSVPAGAKLTDEQFTAFKAGNLYVNVHSAANKGGEIRGQLKP
jgi:hypothetical protein